MERHYYFPLRMIYGQNRRDRIQRRRIDLVRSIVTLYKYANRLSLIKLVKAMLASQTSRSREYSLLPRGHLLHVEERTLDWRAHRHVYDACVSRREIFREKYGAMRQSCGCNSDCFRLTHVVRHLVLTDGG